MTALESTQRVFQEATANGPSAALNMVKRRLRRWAAKYSATSELPLRSEHIFSGDTGYRRPSSPTGERLRIGWVCSAPGPGSGGHTTLFRMVKTAEAAGHSCVLYLYDKYSDDVSRHEPLIRRWWPEMKASVASASVGAFSAVDVLVASSWVSAHVIASRDTKQRPRFYFVQDYEPYFYPRGSLYHLAESTYNFGFVNMALGEMIADAMQQEIGRSPEHIIPFGCDTQAYYPLTQKSQVSTPRRGVIFYAKSDVPRRGFEIGKLALEEFHRMHPDQPIHIFGEKVRGWRIPVKNHGTLTVPEINRLYNSVVAGLTLSFTNVTLTAAEMMAAGVVPVMNRFAGAQRVLGADRGIWADPTPRALAHALSLVVAEPDIEKRALALASQNWPGWEEAAQATIRAIESTMHTEP